MGRIMLQPRVSSCKQGNATGRVFLCFPLGPCQMPCKQHTEAHVLPSPHPSTQRRTFRWCKMVVGKSVN